MLSVLHSISRPNVRLLRRAVLSALGVAAILLGLLAMPSAGMEHATASDVHAVSAHSHGADSAASAANAVAAPGSNGLRQCDAGCMEGLVGCALMVMGCAMLLSIGAWLLFAHRPGSYRLILDAGRHVVAVLRRGPPHLLRPDLAVLSISRT